MSGQRKEKEKPKACEGFILSFNNVLLLLLFDDKILNKIKNTTHKGVHILMVFPHLFTKNNSLVYYLLIESVHLSLAP